MRKPFLMMRTRGIMGPKFGKHVGFASIVKSIGNAFSPGGALGLPVWLALPDQDISQGNPWPLDLKDYTIGETSTYTINTGALPVGITLNADGTFSGTVTNLSGSGSVKFTATNSVGATNSGSLAWTIP